MQEDSIERVRLHARVATVCPRGGRAITLLLSLTTAFAHIARADSPVFVDDDGLCDGNAPCFTTIQAGVDNATDPDGALTGAAAEVNVYPGTYPESVDLSSMGSAVAGTPGDIVLRAANPLVRPLVNPAAGSALFNSVSPFPGEVTVDRFELFAAAGSGADLNTLDGGATFLNLIASENGDNGIRVNAAADVVVHDTVAGFNGADGISIITSGGGVDLQRCTVNDSLTLDGAFISAQLAVTVADLVALRNDGQGLGVITNGPVHVSNSLCLDNGQFGMALRSNLSDVTVLDSQADRNSIVGLLLFSGATLNVQRCSLTWNGFDGTDIISAAQITISDVIADDNGDDGIQIESATGNVTLDPTTANRNGNFGIRVTAQGNVTLLDVQANLNGTQGISVITTAGNAELHRVEANDTMGTDGISVSAQLAATVEDSFTLRNPGFGLSITAGDSIDVSRATSLDNGQSGLFLNSTSGNCSVLDSIATDNSISGIIFDCAGTVRAGRCTAGRSENDSGIDVKAAADVTLSDVHTHDNPFEGVRIHNVTGAVFIDHANADRNGKLGLNITADGDVALHDVEVNRNGQFGINVNAGAGIELLRCAAYDTAVQDGIELTALGNISVADARSERSGEWGLDAVADGAIDISRTTALHNGTSGMNVRSALNDVTVLDCQANDNQEYGMFLSSPGAVTVQRCMADRNVDWVGLRVDFSASADISDVAASDNGTDGVRIIANNAISVENVSCLRNRQYGLHLIGLDTAIDGVHISRNDNGGVFINAIDVATYRVNGSIICDNGDFGLRLNGDPNVNAEGNWWGDASGPTHINNPAGTGDEIWDTAGGTGSGNADYTPWIDTVTAAVAQDPAVAGQPVEVSFLFSDAAQSVFLAQGPGSLLAPAPFLITTDNGDVMTASETAPVVGEWINNPDGLLTVNVIPSASGTANVVLDGPCGLTAGVAFAVDPAPEPEPPAPQEQPMDDLTTDFSTSAAQPGPCGNCGGMDPFLFSLFLGGYLCLLRSRRR